MFAKMTITGINLLLQSSHRDLFDNLELPEGVDKDAVINMIYLRGGDYPVTYTDPDFMYNSLKSWSLAHYRTFKKWWDALNINYAPLENYDRIEDITDLRLNNKTANENSEDNINTSHQITRSHNDNTLGQETETGNGSDNKELTREEKLKSDIKRKSTHNISAYNSSADYVKDYEDASEETDENTNNITEKGNTTATTSRTNNNSVNTSGYSNDTDNGIDKHLNIKNGSENARETYTRQSKVHGNIGVTTSQQMLESELKVARWNIYEHIADAFIADYCIPIYI